MPQEEKQHQSGSLRKPLLHCALREGSLSHPSTSAETVIVASSHRRRCCTCRLEAAIVASFHTGPISRLAPASFTPSPIPLLGAPSPPIAPTFVHTHWD